MTNEEYVSILRCRVRNRELKKKSMTLKQWSHGKKSTLQFVDFAYLTFVWDIKKLKKLFPLLG